MAKFVSLLHQSIYENIEKNIAFFQKRDAQLSLK